MASVDDNSSCNCDTNMTLVNEPSTTVDPIRRLYPAVNELETPLPRQWSTKEKSPLLGLSQNNLTVHYKGSTSKNQKDASSIRATNFIPPTCGIYYFEVTVISKGRDGYMGIGLSTANINLNRLPGWDKNSYGYHGDDGNSFCSSGTGQPYGPQFTTGDVIGCGLNLIENTCFYTKNGMNLGVAFRDLPPNLYPTIGLQTPGEIVEANFGQTPFVYNIQDYFDDWRSKINTEICSVPVQNKTGEWQQSLHRLISTYLVHHGYCASAEAFLHSTGQSCDEELVSIQNRQKLQSLILAGHIGDAITLTQQLYPGLLDENVQLLFLLKCRQFIEIINGTEGETIPTDCMPPARTCRSARTHTSRPPNRLSSSLRIGDKNCCLASPIAANGEHASNGTPINLSTSSNNKNGTTAVNGETRVSGECRVSTDLDADMDTSEAEDRPARNGTERHLCVNGCTEQIVENEHAINSYIDSDDDISLDANMDVDQRTSNAAMSPEDGLADSVSCLGEQLCGGSETAVRHLLQFGRYLHQLSLQLIEEESSQSDEYRKTLRNAFSLLAYADPWNSPVGFQLNPNQREPVCMALNSAILTRLGLPKQPPLELALAHASQCLQLLSKSGIPSCALVDINNYLH